MDSSVNDDDDDELDSTVFHHSPKTSINKTIDLDDFHRPLLHTLKSQRQSDFNSFSKMIGPSFQSTNESESRFDLTDFFQFRFLFSLGKSAEKNLSASTLLNFGLRSSLDRQMFSWFTFVVLIYADWNVKKSTSSTRCSPFGFILSQFLFNRSAFMMSEPGQWQTNSSSRLSVCFHQFRFQIDYLYNFILMLEQLIHFQATFNKCGFFNSESISLLLSVYWSRFFFRIENVQAKPRVFNCCPVSWSRRVDGFFNSSFSKRHVRLTCGFLGEANRKVIRSLRSNMWRKQICSGTSF